MPDSKHQLKPIACAVCLPPLEDYGVRVWRHQWVGTHRTVEIVHRRLGATVSSDPSDHRLLVSGQLSCFPVADAIKFVERLCGYQAAMALRALEGVAKPAAGRGDKAEEEAQEAASVAAAKRGKKKGKRV